MEEIKWTFSSFDQLTNKELYEIVRLRLEIFVLEQDCPYQDCDRKDYVSIHLQGRVGDEVLAYCRIMDRGVSYEDYPSIGRVVTSEKIRGQGYGKILMKKAISYSLAHFGETIKLSGQAYLRSFYEDLGFEVVSENTYLEDNIPHYAMIYS